MGVEYDIKCLDCDEGADIGSGCSKNLPAFRAILEARSLLEKWADAEIDIEIKVDGWQMSRGATPEFFGRHKTHILAVVGDNGRDYTVECDEPPMVQSSQTELTFGLLEMK